MFKPQTFFERQLAKLSLSDVPGSSIDQVAGRGCSSFKPAVGAVFAAVAVLERNQFLPRHQGGDSLTSLLQIVGVDEVKELLRHEFFSGVAKDPFPGRVQAQEITVRVRNAQ